MSVWPGPNTRADFFTQNGKGSFGGSWDLGEQPELRFPRCAVPLELNRQLLAT
jgi:hypothetical protein